MVHYFHNRLLPNWATMSWYDACASPVPVDPVITLNHFTYPMIHDDGGTHDQAGADGTATPAYPGEQTQESIETTDNYNCSVVVSMWRPRSGEAHSRWSVAEPHLVTAKMIDDVRLLSMTDCTAEDRTKVEFMVAILTKVLSWHNGFHDGDQSVAVEMTDCGFIAIAETHDYPPLSRGSVGLGGYGTIFDVYKDDDGKFWSRVECWGRVTEQMRDDLEEQMYHDKTSENFMMHRAIWMAFVVYRKQQTAAEVEMAEWREKHPAMWEGIVKKLEQEKAKLTKQRNRIPIMLVVSDT
jgi:hypothetical protein